MTLKNNISGFKIIIFSIIIIFLITGYLYEKKINLFEEVEKNIIVLMKNKTWDTELKSNIPYNKGDELEYSIILKPNNSKITSIDISKIKENIIIKNISLNGENININDLDKINIDKETIIKIDGEAKNDNEQSEESLINIKTEEIIEEELIEEEIIEEKLISNLKINKTSFSSNINNLLEITGDNLEQIKFVNIGGNSFIPKFNDGKLFVGIDSNIFGQGSYFVLFQLNNGKIITYDKQITFVFSDLKVSIANITPNIVKNDIDRNIVLQGVGFSKVISIQLSNNIILKNTNFNIINDNVMSLLIPKELNVGKYKLNIMDVEGIYKSNLEIEIIN